MYGYDEEMIWGISLPCILFYPSTLSFPFSGSIKLAPMCLLYKFSRTSTSTEKVKI